MLRKAESNQAEAKNQPDNRMLCDVLYVSQLPREHKPSHRAKIRKIESWKISRSKITGQSIVRRDSSVVYDRCSIYQYFEHPNTGQGWQDNWGNRLL